jgi:hypothetical protein
LNGPLKFSLRWFICDYSYDEKEFMISLRSIEPWAESPSLLLMA